MAQRHSLLASDGPFDGSGAGSEDFDLLAATPKHPCPPASFSAPISAWHGNAPDASLGTEGYLAMPSHYTPGYAYPLIVYLHGDGTNRREVRQVMPHISPQNYIAVGIDGNRSDDSNGHRWSWDVSAGAVDRLAERVERAIEGVGRRCQLRADRIILVGRRDGGSAAIAVAAAMQRSVAAVVSLGGRMPPLRVRNYSDLISRRLRLLWLWGADNPAIDDATLQTDGRAALAIGARLDVRVYPTDDEADTAVFADVNRWIMERVVLDRSNVVTTETRLPTASLN